MTGYSGVLSDIWYVCIAPGENAELCQPEGRDQPHQADGAAQPVRARLQGAQHRDVHQDWQPQARLDQVSGETRIIICVTLKIIIMTG